MRSPLTINSAHGASAPESQARGAISSNTSGDRCTARHSSPPSWCSCVQRYSSPGRPSSTEPGTSSCTRPRQWQLNVPRLTNDTDQPLCASQYARSCGPASQRYSTTDTGPSINVRVWGMRPV